MSGRDLRNSANVMLYRPFFTLIFSTTVVRGWAFAVERRTNLPEIALRATVRVDLPFPIESSSLLYTAFGAAPTAPVSGAD